MPADIEVEEHLAKTTPFERLLIFHLDSCLERGFDYLTRMTSIVAARPGQLLRGISWKKIL
jgi:hypothetical protein